MNSLEVLVLRVGTLEKRVVELERENTIPRERLLKYEKPKNSRNSSTPPSKDENRSKKNQGLRRKSDKKIGGQPGHKGSTLKMVEALGSIIEHIAEFCGVFGTGLAQMPLGKMVKRQVVGLPPIVPR
ncbi:hypothetical protein MNBD_BACTEROID03-117 [hydrothermal vent metagenome]|uniref:DUF6444 domain-containing protein n=1 Tax=hydrothermal vent metagenome TaxID=652676 RepID=A0A3B0TK06_9ZZZZ